jgi:hypothetical protein
MVSCALAVAGCGLTGSPAPVAGPVVAPDAAARPHLASSRHSRTSTKEDPRAFAGYNLHLRRVRMIAASWRVPAVSESSKAGAGSTWIGVQPPSGGWRTPFIQVGTTDQRDLDKYNDYEAFWTDTDHHFHPIGFMTVLPGERVSASLTLVGHRWRIRFVDHTSGQSREIVTTQEASAVLRQAEWVQEDPSMGKHPHETRQPYARTVPVRFSALRANGSVPRPQDLLPQEMVLPHGELTPTLVHGDSFTVTAGKGAVPPPRSVRATAPSLTPPAAYTSGTAQPPTPGAWNAVGTVTASEGYANDPPGTQLPRTWLISRSCEPGSRCTYTLNRTFASDSGSPSLIRASLVPTRGGWRVVWRLPLICRTDAFGQIHWVEHEVWLMRFLNHGTVAQARESSLSYNPRCGYGRSSTTWRATLTPAN